MNYPTVRVVKVLCDFFIREDLNFSCKSQAMAKKAKYFQIQLNLESYSTSCKYTIS